MNEREQDKKNKERRARKGRNEENYQQETEMKALDAWGNKQKGTRAQWGQIEQGAKRKDTTLKVRGKGMKTTGGQSYSSLIGV